MDANLVRPARLERQGEELRTGKALENTIMRDGVHASGGARARGTPRAGRRPRQGIRDRPGVGRQASMRQREVFTRERVTAELLRKDAVRDAAPREDKQAGSLPINAMQEPQIGSLHLGMALAQVARKE